MLPCILSAFGHYPRHGLGDHTGQDTLQKSVGTRTGKERCITVGMPDMAFTLGDGQLTNFIFLLEVICVTVISCHTLCPFISLKRRKADHNKGFVPVVFLYICVWHYLGLLLFCFNIKHLVLLCFYKLGDSKI